MIGIQCINCIYFLDRASCAVFPKGIPEEIITGKIDHSIPYNGDNGVVFESIERINKEGVITNAGTSEGVRKAWDKRGCGRKSQRGEAPIRDSKAIAEDVKSNKPVTRSEYKQLKSELLDKGINKVVEKASTSHISTEDRPIIYAADIEGIADGIKSYKRDDNITFHDTGDGVIAKIDGKKLDI